MQSPVTDSQWSPCRWRARNVSNFTNVSQFTNNLFSILKALCNLFHPSDEVLNDNHISHPYTFWQIIISCAKSIRMFYDRRSSGLLVRNLINTIITWHLSSIVWLMLPSTLLLDKQKSQVNSVCNILVIQFTHFAYCSCITTFIKLFIIYDHEICRARFIFYITNKKSYRYSVHKWRCLVFVWIR